MNKSIVIAAAILALTAPAYAQQQDGSSVIAAAPASEQTGAQLNLIGLVQTKLKEAGLYSGEITGVRTNQTTRAIRAFQRAHNLHVNGDLNDETRTALGV